MKRLAAACLIIFLIGILLGLSQTAQDPADFSGIWYTLKDQSPYVFQKGLITGPKSTDPMVGAYWYCKDSVVLFVQDVEGLEKERELYLISDREVNLLCESSDGTGIVYFIRYRK